MWLPTSYGISAIDFTDDGAAELLADSGGDLLSEDQNSANYYDWSVCQMERAYFWNEGLQPMPPAGPSQSPPVPCRIVRLHAPTCRMVIAWEIMRYGDWPTVPSADTQNANEVLLDKVIFVGTPRLLKDDVSYAYTVSGLYIYQLLVPPTEQDYLYGGTLPSVITTPEQNVLGPERYSKNLIRSAPPAGFGTVTFDASKLGPAV